MGVSQHRGPYYSTLNSRILIVRPLISGNSHISLYLLISTRTPRAATCDKAVAPCSESAGGPKVDIFADSGLGLGVLGLGFGV